MLYQSTQSRNNMKWLIDLDTEGTLETNYRKCSIIGTIGPNTNNVESLVNLRKAGLNVARLNFSHGSYEYHASVIGNCRKSTEVYPGRPLAIALDTKGPEIRTGTTKEGKDYPISAGDYITLTTDDKYKTACDAEFMYVDYKNITKVIEVGKYVYVDDGNLQLRVEEIVNESTVKALAVNSGAISSHKGVNLPNTDVDLPALSEKDKNDLRFGVEQEVDMVFASFIRSGNDIKEIRKVLGEKGKNIQIIAKIENQQGVRNFDDILAETDGVMVARGDLGIEIPAPRVFLVQKQLIAKCNAVGKPVICATQMLESMTYNPRPTRAEVSDVGNAVLDGADCVMLSGETAKGKYPVESVTMMRETCLIAEQSISYNTLFNELRQLNSFSTDMSETVAMAAVTASIEQRAGAIVVLSTSGNTARLLAKYRPVCPILMITRNAAAARYCHLYRGVYPFVYNEPRATNAEDWQNDVEDRVRFAVKEASGLGIIADNANVIAIQGWKAGGGHTNTMRILTSDKVFGKN